ncbi:hypothetical protein BDF20DRAFT_875619 [Mycotypha africana]|uniref:uncharacterized protein n=1 Tax=Mycotypha africana TaxID=64632 RepID=UPI0022FFFDD3|nr:uncharacterized protein BDF20DRAFT_875619 [Mycotypha africana]KAI8977580.1 hypothetical protein BDF20DRAFT_875619 [Mycotypha africana]
MATTTIVNTPAARRLSLLPLSSANRTHTNALSSQSNSSTMYHQADSRNSDGPKLSIHFNEGPNLTIRPNRIVRGHVKLKTSKIIYASQIRVKFKAVEVACVKVKETKTEDRIEKLTTTYFEIETRVFGSQENAYFLNNWQTIEPGEYEYKFAMKFPNVNFPPSLENPTGFSVRYLWTAYLDGAANHPGARSAEVSTIYRPLLCAPEANPWVFQETLYKDKKTPVATIKVKLPAQVFVPEQITQLDIEINCIPSDISVGSLGYKFRKCYEGKLQLERGIVHKVFKRDIHQKMINIKDNAVDSGNSSNLYVPNLQLQLPSWLLSPCFQSNHIRVYYYLILMVQLDPTNLLKSSYHTQVQIPIGIANVSHEHFARLPGMTTIQHYKNSREAPVFFDANLEEPPGYPISPPLSTRDSTGELFTSPLSTLLNPDDEALLGEFRQNNTTVPTNSGSILSPSSPPSAAREELLPPPDYFSLNDIPQYIEKERVEKTRYSTRLVKPNMLMELGEPLTIEPYSDDEW